MLDSEFIPSLNSANGNARLSKGGPIKHSRGPLPETGQGLAPFPISGDFAYAPALMVRKMAFMHGTRWHRSPHGWRYRLRHNPRAGLSL